MSIFRVVRDNWVKIGLMCRDDSIEIHEIFSEGAGLIEAAKFYHPAGDNFILDDT
jgi:hypothetical protein